MEVMGIFNSEQQNAQTTDSVDVNSDDAWDGGRTPLVSISTRYSIKPHSDG